MKWLILLGLWTGLSVHAQQAPRAASEFQATTQSPAPSNAARPGGTLTGSANAPHRPLVFKRSGLIVDFAQSKNRLGLLSLRVPYRPEAETQNLLMDPATGRVRGWVLFSLRF